MYDIVIIGAGPAGMTGALYSARAGKKICLLECNSFGGQISYSPCVENFPSVDKISGNEFSDRLLGQITELGVDIEFEKAVKITGDDVKTVLCESGKSFECRAVIIATGVKHRHLQLENEENLIGKGVSYCAVCDGAFFRGKDVAVIGGGNTALQDALYLSNLCSKVYVIHRRQQFRADKPLVEKAMKSCNIEFITDSVVTSIRGDKMLDSIVVTDKNTEKSLELNVSGLFIAIGQIPQNADFIDAEGVDDEGYFVTGENTVTETKGIFVAGDCRRKNVRQLTTACCDGAVSATNACIYIDSL